MEFHTKLAMLMERRGMTQSALGEMLGVTHRAVGNWLDGSKPHSRRALDLANVFGVSAEELLDDAVDLAVTSSKHNTGETITGYTKPVPIHPPASRVAGEGGQAKYGESIRPTGFCIPEIKFLWQNLSQKQQAKVATSFIDALLQEFEKDKK